jgi:hypothetical protein
MITHKPGTVVRYRPERTWCREGTAIADDNGLLYDTYWHSGQDVLSDAEAASAEVLFHLDDYEEIDRYQRMSSTWESYHPDDRRVITSQHRLQKRWLIRKDAVPHLGHEQLAALTEENS